MKQSRLFLIIVLILLIVTGWGTAILDGSSGKNSEYEGHIRLAEDYYNRGLFQKSAQEYELAVEISNSEEDWFKLLDAYRACYAESGDIYDDYVDAASRAVVANSENPDFVLTLAQLYLENEEYDSAYECLEEALSSGMEEARVNELAISVQYSYELFWTVYSDFGTWVNDYYTVSRDGVWDYMTLEGTDEDWGNYSYVGPVGTDGIRVVYDGKRAVLMDADKVLQGILAFVPDQAGVYANEVIPIKANGKYAYYNQLGDIQFGSYTMASTFVDGKAAVEDAGKWYIIDNAGEQASGAVYEDIVLNLNGGYIMDDIMIAQVKGQYHFYDESEKQIGNFSCNQIDVMSADGLIAFGNGGKWGYVDKEGNEVIVPSYAQAKSFSNGLAAVSNGEKWGFINEDGILVIDYIFTDVDYFNERGSCMVCTEDGWQLLTLNIT